MLVEFKKNLSENIRINKNIIDMFDTGTQMRNDFDLQNPVIEFTINPVDSNYAYIPDVNRYYFIDKIEAIRQNLFRVHFSIDVLMTYKDEIMNLDVILQESKSNPYYSGYISNYDLRTQSVKIEPDRIEYFDEDGIYILSTVFGTRIFN